MGNCLVVLLREEKAKRLIKIMTVDGEILAQRPPLKVREALSESPGHAISESLPVVRQPDDTDADDMLSGNYLDCLRPPPKVQATEAKTGQGTRMVRIKLVMSKQELKEMLSKAGVLSLGEMISQLQLQSGPAAMAFGSGGGDSARCRSWKPVLESIPEAHDLY